MNVKVDEVYAFVANGVGGNRAGVVLDAEKLSDKQMQYVASTVGASETAFVLSDNEAVHRVRFFTPTVEVPLCGHATIATWSLMHRQGLHKAGTYTQDTQAGLINISVADDGLIFMEQPPQEIKQILSFAEISEALGIPEDNFSRSFKPQIVQNGLMLALKSKAMLNSFNLDAAKLIAFNKKHDFEPFHIFVMLNDQDVLAAVRDFDPIVGIDEDAATGTTNGSFLAYLRHYNALPDRQVYKIEQGEAMGQLSHIYGKFVKDRVWIGGRAQESTCRQIELV